MNKINDNLYTFEGQQDIVSPQLVYYPAIIRENIRKMIDIAGGAARLWPHIKTHKMAEVVQMQIEAGIDRFKCATIAEAEMAAKAGAKHLTLAYPLVGPNICLLYTAYRRQRQMCIRDRAGPDLQGQCADGCGHGPAPHRCAAG